MNALLVFVSSAALLLGADDAKKDLDQFQGTWTVVKAERGGKELPKEELKKMEVSVQENVMSITEDKSDPKAKPEKAVLELDPSKKPKSINFKPEEGKDKPILGIYELKDDTLKVYWLKSDGKRPESFSDKPNPESFLLVLKRAKKD
jgi:uncharacterized protein (TIGR03067 family)